MSTETNKATIAAAVAAKKATFGKAKKAPVAAKKAAPKKSVAKTAVKTAVKAANKIDACMALLDTKTEKGIHLHVLMEKLGEDNGKVRRLIDQVRANRNRLVERVAPLTFKLRGIRNPVKG